MKIKPYLKSLVEDVMPELPDGQEVEFLDCGPGMNSYGVSEKILDAAKKYHWPEIWWHPDPNYKDLKEKIVEFWSVHTDLQMDQIQINNGSLEFLSRVNAIFLEPATKVLGFSPQFPAYGLDAQVCGARYDAVTLNPEEHFRFYVERLLEKIGSQYSLIYIDNPNNPTGQLISLEAIDAIAGKARDHDLAIIVDEAYGDYMEPSQSAINLTGKYNNLIVTRTFSKGYGLCSLRIGYGILPVELIDYYKTVTPPFRASSVGSYLAEVAISDHSFVTSCRQRVRMEKQKLIDGLEERSYLVSESYEYCPVFLAGHKNPEFDLSNALIMKGILTDPGTRYGVCKNYVRINCPASAEEFFRRLDSSSEIG